MDSFEASTSRAELKQAGRGRGVLVRDAPGTDGLEFGSVRRAGGLGGRRWSTCYRIVLSFRGPVSQLCTVSGLWYERVRRGGELWSVAGGLGSDRQVLLESPGAGPSRLPSTSVSSFSSDTDLEDEEADRLFCRSS